MKRSPGFTLIETLVIAGIVLLLLAFLAPALWRAREQAKRVHCRNNLRQLGTALGAYESTFRIIPPGIVPWGDERELYGIVPYREFPDGLQDATRKDPMSGTHYVLTPAARTLPGAGGTSGLALLLPFLEQGSPYDAYNFELGCIDRANVTATTRTVDGFLCPSNPRGASPVDIPAYPRKPAPTDYVFSLGAHALVIPSFPWRWSMCGPGDWPYELIGGKGPFSVAPSPGTRQIRDGTANTILMGEGAGGMPHGRSGGSDYGGDIPDQPNSGAVVDQAWSQGFLGTRDGFGGYGSVFAATAYDARYRYNSLAADRFTPLPINLHAAPLMRGSTYGRSYYYGVGLASQSPYRMPPDVSMSPFRSYHRNCAYFVFADGSVNALSDDIDSRIYVALSTIFGGEPITQSDWESSR